MQQGTSKNFSVNFVDFWNSENKRNLIELKRLVFLAILFSIIFNAIYFTVFASSSDSTMVNTTTNTKIETSVNTQIVNYCNKIGGTTSGIVSISSSPIVSLAVFSWIGTLQNNDINLPTFSAMAQKFPLNLSSTPIAHMDVSIVLTFILFIVGLLRIIPFSKIFTFSTIDKLERMVGQIVAILLIFATSSATTALAASTNSATDSHATIVTSILTTCLSIIFSIASGIIYYFIKTICLALEIFAFLSSPFPILSGTVETAKAGVSFALTLLPFINPIASLIISVLIIIFSICFFKKAYNVVVYFKYIYVKPFWNGIFHSRKIFPFIYNKVPKKVTQKFASIEIAIPVFPLKAIGKIKKKSMCWFITTEGTPYICKNYFFKSPLCVSLNDLITEEDNIHLHKAFRFLRIFSEEKIIDSHKKLLLILSREYGNQFEDIIDITGFVNYNKLEEQRKEERRLATLEKKQQKLLDKYSNTSEKNKTKMDFMQTKHDIKLEHIKEKQLLKQKQNELKVNLKQSKNVCEQNSQKQQ